MCERFEIDIMRGGEYAESIFSKFIIQRADQNVNGSKWLSRVLNSGGFPVYLFFDDSKKLMAIEVGAMPEKRMEFILNKLENHKPWIDPNFKLGSIKKSDDVIQYIENLMKAQYQWEKFNETKSVVALNGIEQKLIKTNDIQSSFYNNYLLAKYYAVKKDTLLMHKFAQVALKVDDMNSQFLNAGLRPELKMLVYKNYNLYDDPYLGIENVNKNLGKLKFGSKNNISFPIKNLGKQDLVIKNVFTDCACTVSEFTKANLAPGKTGSINIKFNAKDIGEFTHLIYVQSNSINAPLTLNIQGTVVAD